MSEVSFEQELEDAEGLLASVQTPIPEGDFGVTEMLEGYHGQAEGTLHQVRLITSDPPRTLKQLVESPEAHPLVLNLLMLRKYGSAWLAWAMPAVERALEEISPAVHDLSVSKLMACQACHTSEGPWTHWELFSPVTSALTDVLPDFEQMQVVDPVQITLAIGIMNTLEDRHELWSDEVRRYLSASFQYHNVACPIPPVNFISVAGEWGGLDRSIILRHWSTVRDTGNLPVGGIEGEQLRRMKVMHDAQMLYMARLKQQLPLVKGLEMHPNPLVDGFLHGLEKRASTLSPALAGAAMLGGTGLVGGVSEARRQGADWGEAVQQGLRKGGRWALAGGLGGGAAGVVGKVSPTARNFAEGVTDYGKKTLYSLTGHGGLEGLHRAGGGSAATAKRLEEAQAALSQATTRRGQAEAAKQVAHLTDSHQAVQAAEEAGLLHLPGLAKGIVSAPKENLRKVWDATVKGTTPAEKALLGAGAGASVYFAGKDDPNNPRTGLQRATDVLATGASQVVSTPLNLATAVPSLMGGLLGNLTVGGAINTAMTPSAFRRGTLPPATQPGNLQLLPRQEGTALHV